MANETLLTLLEVELLRVSEWHQVITEQHHIDGSISQLNEPNRAV